MRYCLSERLPWWRRSVRGFLTRRADVCDLALLLAVILVIGAFLYDTGHAGSTMILWGEL